MSAPHKVFVVTTSRADYGIYASLLHELDADPAIDLGIVVGGSHLSDAYGMTVNAIEKDGYNIVARVPCVPQNDSDEAIAVTMGEAQIGFSEALAAARPDMIIVLGDRYEMHSAALAALPLRIPVAHIHGGEETEGAFDNSLRHSMTKLSHLHLCSTQLAGRRIKAMGEDPAHVHVTGAPALDAIIHGERMSRTDWGARFGVPAGDFALLTYHPVTLSPEETIPDFDKVWKAVNDCGKTLVISLSNADTAGMGLNAHLAAIAAKRDDVCLVNNMGALGYYSAMHHADFMIGNSSSGIIEAASFGLPVINVGDRQKGRETSPNVIQVETETAAITQAVTKAQSDAFREICAANHNVYGQGDAAQKITAALHAFFKTGGSIRKPFHLI